MIKIETVKKRMYYLYFVYSFCLVAALLFGYLLGDYFQKEEYANFMKSFRTIRENSDKFTFINPLIGTISAPATDVGIFSDIKDDVHSYFLKQLANGSLYDYSLYFRDLSSGLWFGDNESADFFPASLFKLPIAIAAYKQGEDNPAFLKQSVVYTDSIAKMNQVVQLNSQSTLVIGKSYTVEDLIGIMLKASDNGAKDLILSVLEIKYINQLFAIVALVDPETTQTYAISSAKYSLFFRILYGSSYINDDHSEAILGMLSKSDFKDGMVSGIPSSIAVAHKFGVYQIEDVIKGKKTTTEQLHDCGVVYHATKPYIFCLMTKGKDEETLHKIIGHVSKLIYDYQEKKDD